MLISAEMVQKGMSDFYEIRVTGVFQHFNHGRITGTSPFNWEDWRRANSGNNFVFTHEINFAANYVMFYPTASKATFPRVPFYSKFISDCHEDKLLTRFSYFSIVRSFLWRFERLAQI